MAAGMAITTRKLETTGDSAPGRGARYAPGEDGFAIGPVVRPAALEVAPRIRIALAVAAWKVWRRLEQ